MTHKEGRWKLPVIMGTGLIYVVFLTVWSVLLTRLGEGGGTYFPIIVCGSPFSVIFAFPANKFDAVHGELPLKQRLAVQTIRGNGFASGNSQGWRVEGLGRPLSPRACRRIALGVHAPHCKTL